MEGAIMSARTACVILGILATTAIGGAQQGAGQGEWTRYGGDPGSTKYAPLDQIDKEQRLPASRRLATAGRRSQPLLARA